MRSTVPLWTAASVLVAAHANAQVNTEALRQRIKVTGASLVVQWTFDGRTGNTRGVAADGLVGAGVGRGRQLAFAFASFDYARVNGTLGVDRSFGHARYNYEVADVCWWEVFVQAQSDLFQRIKIRNLFGTGPRFALYEDKDLRVSLGVAYMFERDVIDTAPGAAESREQLAHRISSYLTAHATLSDGIDAVTTTFMQPRIDDPSDLRVLNESGFIFKVGKSLSITLSFVAHYDSKPPTSVLPTDAELKNAIAVSL